jgi:hypothetical protein
MRCASEGGSARVERLNFAAKRHPPEVFGEIAGGDDEHSNSRLDELSGSNSIGINIEAIWVSMKAIRDPACGTSRLVPIEAIRDEG